MITPTVFWEAFALDHVAIMEKSLGLTRKILSGEKTIESRWYRTKRAPWGRIEAGDTVYFKDSGAPVTVRAEVAKVVQCDGLTPAKVKEILGRYGPEIGIAPDGRPAFYETVKDKRYCLLIFLMNARGVEPFEIDKRGFGVRAAWITVEDVGQIKTAVSPESSTVS